MSTVVSEMRNAAKSSYSLGMMTALSDRHGLGNHSGHPGHYASDPR